MGFLFALFFIIKISPHNEHPYNNTSHRQSANLQDNSFSNIKKYYDEKVNNLKQEKIQKFTNIKLLPLLGLEEFMKNYNEKETYLNIFLTDAKEMIEFIDKTLQGCLNTACLTLIQGTIDLISKQLEKNIFLKIEKHMVKNAKNNFHNEEYSATTKFEEQIVCQMKNINNSHFYIEEYNDTLVDGYCFFHALNNILKKELNGDEFNKLQEKIKKAFKSG
ncbi:MAG: hypothetical protein QFY14_01645 [Candidatus Phytoplasma pruni]|nr:hypothetical protein [Candidatus Phytoplasma pruni]